MVGKKRRKRKRRSRRSRRSRRRDKGERIKTGNVWERTSRKVEEERKMPAERK